MSEEQQSHLQFEEESEPIMAPLMPPDLQSSLNRLALPQEQEELLSSPVIMEARAAVAKWVQSGPQQPLGVVPLLWLLASPVFIAGMIVTFGVGRFETSLLFAFLLATANRMHSFATQNEQMRTALTLPNVNNAWVGPLTEILEWPGARTQRIAMHLLSHLLPNMTRKEWDSLNKNQKRILYARLDPRYTKHEADLQIALLRALDRLGETSAIRYVERLEEGLRWGANRRRVRQEATLCQKSLEMKEQAEAARLSQMASLEEGVAGILPQEVVTEKVPPELEVLIGELREAREKSTQPGMRLPYLFASWCIIVPFTVYQGYLSFVDGSKMLSLLWAVLTAIGTQLHRLTLLPWQTAHVKRLAQYDSVKGVGYLAEVLEWPDASSQSAASSALIRLLPRLRASDSHLLNPKQRMCLYRRLSLGNARKDYDLILATLKALEQVGDMSALGYVQKLAQAQPLTAAQRRVVQAAQDCLPYLLKRAEANEGSQYLLRAAHAIDASPETLLRPASEQNVPQDDLLRPINLLHPEDE